MTANEEIGQRLEQWVRELPSEDGGDSGMLGDWMAVVSMVSVDDEGQPRVQYYLTMRGGTMLPHMLHGLLDIGKDLITEQTNTRE